MHKIAVSGMMEAWARNGSFDPETDDVVLKDDEGNETVVNWQKLLKFSHGAWSAVE